MFLLAYRSSNHETTGLIPAELYFAQDLRLPVDLLRENPPKSERFNSAGDYLSKIKGKNS